MQQLQEKFGINPIIIKKPFWNPWQYLFVFIGGFIVDLIVHTLAYQHKKYNGIGFGAYLMPKYKYLRFVGPMSIDYPTTKSVIYGGIFSGILCMLALVVSDALLTWLNKDEEL